MRSIKFRAFTPKDSHFKGYSELMYVPDAVSSDGFPMTSDTGFLGSTNYYVEKHDILMLSTGFKIGETDVYDSDILEFSLENGEKEIGVVRFADGGFWTSQKEGTSEELLSEELEFYKDSVKIIGNLHQNPGLIK